MINTRDWFELGMKIGCIELTAKLCNLPQMLISPHDIEDVHYEILNYINEMGLDSTEIADARIEDYSNLALNLIESPSKSIKRQLFLLGYYMVKLKILLVNELDDVFNERREKLYDYISVKIDELKLSRSLKKISIKEFREENFNDIEEAINNNSQFDASEEKVPPQDKDKKFKIEMIIVIIVALIGALATIVAAIISKL